MAFPQPIDRAAEAKQGRRLRIVEPLAETSTPLGDPLHFHRAHLFDYSVTVGAHALIGHKKVVDAGFWPILVGLYSLRYGFEPGPTTVRQLPFAEDLASRADQAVAST